MCLLLMVNWQSGIHEINCSSEMWPKPSQDVGQMLNFNQHPCCVRVIHSPQREHTGFLDPKLSFPFLAWSKLATHDAIDGLPITIVRFREKKISCVIKRSTEKQVTSHCWDSGARSRNWEWLLHISKRFCSWHANIVRQSAQVRSQGLNVLGG